LNEALETMEVVGAGDASEAQVEAVDAAKGAVRKLLGSDAFGAYPYEDGVRITLSGHANPGHAPSAGATPDYVTVTVAQQPRMPLSPVPGAEGSRGEG